MTENTPKKDPRIHYADNTKFNALVKKALAVTVAAAGVAVIVVLVKKNQGWKQDFAALYDVLELSRAEVIELTERYYDSTDKFLDLSEKYIRQSLTLEALTTDH